MDGGGAERDRLRKTGVLVSQLATTERATVETQTDMNNTYSHTM